MNEFSFILPSNNDGGGNRWSFLLASKLIEKNNDFNINFYYPNFKKLSNIYKLNKKVKLIPYNVQNNNRLIVLIKFIFFLKKKLNKNSTIIVSDPLLSIFLFFFKNKKIIRNVASDDYNLYNSSSYKYLGLIPLYKLLIYLSFFYRNVIYVFNSQYTYSRIYGNSKIPFRFNDIQNKIIYPMIDNSYLENQNYNLFLKDKERSIVIFPRKHNNKGFDLFHSIKNKKIFKSLRIEKIYLVFNKMEDFKYYNDKDYTIIHPKSDKDIIRVLDKSMCFVSTSSSEGFGLPPLEAMSRGCVPVLIDAGGTSSYCFHGYNSLVCPKNNIFRIIKNIEKLLKDHKLRTSLIKNGIKTSKIFSEDNISNQWSDYISTLLKYDKTKKTGNIISFIKIPFQYYFRIYNSCDFKIKSKIFIEFIFFPFLVFFNLIQYVLSIFINEKITKKRNKKFDGIKICIQDWSEYKDLRYKTLKNGIEYKCGLKNQYKKFISNKYKSKKYLYLSGSLNNRYANAKDIDDFKKNGYEINYSDNKYLDFSSYEKFFSEKVNKNKNEIIIFMNSSVSTEFNEPILDNYVEFFLKNLDVGLLGISANSSKYQSIIPYNFHPHIQSLFFITTTKVMNDVIKFNNHLFPGFDATINNKYSLIINGEIKLSQIIMKLGYKIAIINEYGKVNKFKAFGIFKNRYYWPTISKDQRLKTNYPAQAKLIDTN